MSKKERDGGPDANKRLRTGVIVFNLGGPESLEDVERFLYQLYSDSEILRIRSHFIRSVLASTIALLRRREVRGHYRKIGNRSPLRQITEEQAQALSDELRWAGWQVDVFVGMCYWRPFFKETLDAVERRDLDRLVILPLFPQYSSTTTGAGFRALERLLQVHPTLAALDTRWISSWQNQPTYIAAFSERIRKELAEFPDPARVQILFSAHSLPEHYDREGHSYLEQTSETVELLADSLGRANPYRLCFQSKIGPGQRLGPSTNDVIVELGRQGVNEMLVVPVTSVAEHIETLYEIDIQYRRVAADVGVRLFRRVSALNCDPTFILSLRELVEAAVE
jgi:protoporphyrin/coproporphyrin ferrochelatase